MDLLFYLNSSPFETGVFAFFPSFPHINACSLLLSLPSIFKNMVVQKSRPKKGVGVIFIHVMSPPYSLSFCVVFGQRGSVLYIFLLCWYKGVGENRNWKGARHKDRHDRTGKRNGGRGQTPRRLFVSLVLMPQHPSPSYSLLCSCPWACKSTFSFFFVLEN